MFDKATNCLTEIDFFGKFYYFTFNKESRYTSACGGLISMSVALGFLIALWFLGKEIVFKESPIVVFNYQLDAERYNRNMNVPFAFVIENINGLVLDNYERYFSFSALYINFSKSDYSKDFTILRHNIPMRKCKPTDFSDDPIIQANYRDNNLQFAYCLWNYNQTIGGSWGQLWNYYINVTLEPCYNGSVNNVTCASTEEINYYIVHREIQVSMYYEDMVLTTTNNKKPLTRYLKNDHQRIQLNTAKTNEYFLQDVIVTTDNGWIFPSRSVESTQILTSRFFDFYNNNLQFVDNRVIAAISFNIFASWNKYEIYRYYLKMQDVFAQLGGILKVVFMFFEGFLYLIYCHKHEESLIRNLFRPSSLIKKEGKDFRTVYNIKPTKLDEIATKQTQQNKREDINLIEKRPIENTILNTSNQLILNTNNNQQQSKIMTEEVNLNKYNIENDSEVIERVLKTIGTKKCKNIEDERFTFSYPNVILIVFCPCFLTNSLKKKERIFRHLVEYTKRYSDAINIIKTVNEIEKLKQIIFDEKQLALFTLISEPRNPMDSFEGELKINSFSKEKLYHTDTAKTYLTELKIRKNFTNVEKRLLDLYLK